jgi:chemotaxis methyl-accepting protein methylase
VVTVIDGVRPVFTAEGRAELWTKVAHARELHQSTPFTAEDRYPELMRLAGRLRPDAKRILSFGCSTGEELVTLRRYFPSAEKSPQPKDRGRRATDDRRVSLLRLAQSRDPSTSCSRSRCFSANRTESLKWESKTRHLIIHSNGSMMRSVSWSVAWSPVGCCA